MNADAKIAAFEQDVLLPALNEIRASDSLAKNYDVSVRSGDVSQPAVDAWSAWSQESGGADAEALWAKVDKAVRMRRRGGPSLLLTNRTRKHGWPDYAGVFTVIPYYQVMGAEVFASPGVGYWMKFNGNVHVFAHRYDNAIANHRIEDVTKSHILNHVLNSVSFYEMYAFRDQPFPGYR